MTEPRDVAGHRALVSRLFGSLAPIVSFEPVGDGWTCDTYRVNGDWIVQLPRTADAAESLMRQMDVLPELAVEVSAPVPMPELTSRDPAAMAYRRIEGVAAITTDGVWPERLGRFLYDLHMVRPEYVGMRAGSPAAVRDVLGHELEELRDRVFPLLRAPERDALAERFLAFLEDGRHWGFSPCVTHNDLVAAHVLVSDEGDLAGVIDWEEVGIGDPAADFAWILGAEPEVGERALAAYGGAPDDRFRARCGFYFTLMPWHDVAHGVESDDDELVERGLALLRERGRVL